MLQSIRDNAQGIFVWIIVGLIIVAFALFGLGSYLSGASKVVAASVNGVDISDSQVTRAYRNYQERLMKMFGEQYRPEMFNEKRLRQEVLQGLVTQEVMSQMMYEHGYHASPNQVLAEINKIEAFHDQGQFSPKRYKEVLALQGMNSQMFENDISREISSKQLTEAIQTSAFLTASEKSAIAALNNQKREVGYFKASVADYRKNAVVSDDEINKYYDANASRYQTTEKVKLEYVELNLDDIAKQQEISDEMIRQHYESAPESYMTDDTASAKSKLQNLRKQIIAGKDFSVIAKEHSEDSGTAKQGGELGYITKGLMDKSFENVAFTLGKGQISDVVETEFGLHIIKVLDIRTGDPEERKVSHILIKAKQALKPLAMVKDDIRKELQYQQASKLFYDDADKMNNISYETPDSLAPVADALGLKVKESETITRRGGKGLFANSKVITAAFSNEVIKEGRNSELLEISDTQLVVLRVKEHMPSSLRPLAEVKSAIKNSLLHEKASAMAEQDAQAALTMAKKGDTVDAVKKAYPLLSWVDPVVITRDTKGKSALPSAIRSQAYSMPKPKDNKPSWQSTVIGGGDHAVIGLYKVIESDVTAIDEKDSVRYLRGLGITSYADYVENHKGQASISITPVSTE